MNHETLPAQGPVDVNVRLGARTPLTVEMLLFALKPCMTIAGYNGSCVRVIRYDDFVKALMSLSTGVTVKLREHRGSLADSLATTIEIDPTIDALLLAIRNALAPYDVTVEAGMVKVSPYGFDERIGWNAHIVTVDGYGVFGFTNGPLNEPNVEFRGDAPLFGAASPGTKG